MQEHRHNASEQDDRLIIPGPADRLDAEDLAVGEKQRRAEHQKHARDHKPPEWRHEERSTTQVVVEAGAQLGVPTQPAHHLILDLPDSLA